MGLNAGLIKRIVEQIEAQGVIAKAVQDPSPAPSPDTPAKAPPAIEGSVRPGDPYYESPEYKAYQESVAANPYEPGHTSGYISSYFGEIAPNSMPGFGRGRQADANYEQYLARINAPPPPPPPQYADPVYPTPGPRPVPTPAPSPLPPNFFQPQQPQQPQPQLPAPVYAQPGTGNVNFMRDVYASRPEMADPGNYFGTYDRSLFDRIREQALAGARAPVPMAQGGDALFNFLKKNRML